MQIDRSYKIEKCVSTDPNRKNLGNIFVTKRHAMATNGTVLALVPVATGTDDTSRSSHGTGNRSPFDLPVL